MPEEIVKTIKAKVRPLDEISKRILCNSDVGKIVVREVMELLKPLAERIKASLPGGDFKIEVEITIS